MKVEAHFCGALAMYMEVFCEYSKFVRVHDLHVTVPAKSLIKFDKFRKLRIGPTISNLYFGFTCYANRLDIHGVP